MIIWLLGGGGVVAVFLAAVLHEETEGKSDAFFFFAWVFWAILVGIWYSDKCPDKDTIRDCTIHKEIRDTRYCDGVVYEKGNNQ